MIEAGVKGLATAGVPGLGRTLGSVIHAPTPVAVEGHAVVVQDERSKQGGPGNAAAVCERGDFLGVASCQRGRCCVAPPLPIGRYASCIRTPQV